MQCSKKHVIYMHSSNTMLQFAKYGLLNCERHDADQLQVKVTILRLSNFRSVAVETACRYLAQFANDTEMSSVGCGN